MLFVFLCCLNANFRFRISLFMYHVIHGGSVGLTEIFLFGIEISAAFMIAFDISCTFLSIFLSLSIFNF